MGLAIERTDGVVVVHADGDVDMAEVREVFSSLAPDAADDGPMRILVDDRGSSFAPGFDGITQLHHFWSSIFSANPTRIAIVVAKDVHFGMGRQLSAMASAGPPEISVFRNRDEARDWLDAS